MERRHASGWTNRAHGQFVVFMQPTIAGVRAVRDEVLDAAMKLAK
jgi:hypothetical protein